MKEPTYPGALSVAPSVVAHMARQIAAAEAEGRTGLARQPGTRAVEVLIDAAFWASFRREEGQAPQISLAFAAPGDLDAPLTLAKPLPLEPEALARLSPAVERPGIHLGVWGDENEMYVWGATRQIPDLCLVVEVLRPGMLVVKHRRPREFGKFANVAVLEGDQVKIVDERSGLEPDCPAILTSLLGNPSASGMGILIQLAISMRAHGHGGTLLVVPAGSSAWRESVLWPVRYLVDPPHPGLSAFANGSPRGDDGGAWNDGLRGTIAAAAGLTAVDGATLMTDSFELVAFGVKIGRAENSTPVERLRATEPILGFQAEIVHPGQIGGTRHLSAAQFVHDQHDALALVASQDGRFTAFAWSPCHEIVLANRLDALLL